MISAVESAAKTEAKRAEHEAFGHFVDKLSDGFFLSTEDDLAVFFAENTTEIEKRIAKKTWAELSEEESFQGDVQCSSLYFRRRDELVKKAINELNEKTNKDRGRDDVFLQTATADDMASDTCIPSQDILGNTIHRIKVNREYTDAVAVEEGPVGT